MTTGSENWSAPMGILCFDWLKSLTWMQVRRVWKPGGSASIMTAVNEYCSPVGSLLEPTREGVECCCGVLIVPEPTVSGDDWRWVDVKTKRSIVDIGITYHTHMPSGRSFVSPLPPDCHGWPMWSGPLGWVCRVYGTVVAYEGKDTYDSL